MMPAMTPEMPVEGQTEEKSPQEMYGENFENLPEELTTALMELVAKFEKENIQARAEEVRKVQRQREFFKGNQNIFWNGTEKRWAPVTATGVNTGTNDLSEDGVRYDFVENIYRAHALINIAVLSQNPPHAEFLPQNPAQPEDVATAKAALDVATLISDNNTLDERQAEVCWYLFNDGMCASYTYYDVSGDRYGWRSVDEIEQVMSKLTPDTLTCPGCGSATELPDMDYSDPAALGAMPAACATCQAPVSAANFQPGVTASVPQVVGTKQYPQGQERILFMGALELARPFFAKTLEECPWVTWEVEVHKSWIKSVYPGTAEKLKSSNVEGGTESSELTARQARISLAATSYGRQSSEGWSSLVTFRRSWLRPWAFAFIEDDRIRKQLEGLFPDGAYVAFAGAAYCESKTEKLESRWYLKHAFPGDGMIRDGIGTDLIDVQRRLNTEENIQTETFERGIPSRFIDDSIIDYDGYINAGSMACQDFPVQPKPGQKIADGIFDTPAVAVSPQMLNHIENLRGPVPQFLTGNVPTVFGGDTGSNDTASGISMIKDAALGRLALFKRALNDFYAGTMLNAIACFKANRTEDVEAAIAGATADLDSMVIHLDDLRGNLYARTDADESYPVSIAQKRALIQSLLGSANPQIQAAVMAPDNFAMLKATMGMNDLKIPGEDARRKQFRELRLLVQGQPVPVDVLMDQHDVEMGALNEWWSSDEGQQACKDPNVAEMVRQHMYAHLSAKSQQMQLIAGMQPVQPQPGQGGEQPPVQ